MKDLTQDELVSLQGLELLLTWQEIIKYREWALIELRIEAKRFMQSGIEVKPHNLTFTDIWVKCVDAEEIKMKGVGKNFIYNINDVELTFKEKTALYEILASDKDQTLVSFMNGESVERTTKKLAIDIEISFLTVMITELIYEDDAEREKEFATLNFLNMCRCMVCIHRRMRKLKEGYNTDRTEIQGNQENLDEDLHYKSAKNLSSMDDPQLGFENHKVDILNDIAEDSEPNRSTRDELKQSTNKRDVKFQEMHSISECLNIVCFVEVLTVSGSLLALKDGSVSTTNPFAVKNILVFDSSMLNQSSNAFFDQDLEESVKARKDVIYFKLNHEDSRLKGPDSDSKIRLDYIDSKILSKEAYESNLRWFIAAKSTLSDFMDKLSCKRFITFLEHFNK